MSLRVCDECGDPYWDPNKVRSRYFWHRCIECKIKMDWEILVTEAFEKIKETKSLHKVVLLSRIISLEAENLYRIRRLSE